jgi:DNA repair exonuclease SbcCD nuclease subunit
LKVAHLADVHLDSAFRLFSPDVARQRRQAIEASLRAAFEEASDAGVDAVFIAGDLYEHDRVAPDTGEFLRALFAQVAPTPVFVAPGNHDWFGPSSLYARLGWSPNVHVFTADRLEPFELAEGLTLWGAAHCAPANTDGFLERFSVDRGGVNVALFHGSEQGAFAFQEEGKVPHAPFRADQIAACGLTHVFSGHFHTPVDADTYTYPGNPEPLSFGEPASPTRGLVLVTIGGDGCVERERRMVGQTEVRDVYLDVTGCASGNDVRQRAAAVLGELTGCVRVTVTGEVAPEVDVSMADIERGAPGALAVLARVGVLTTAYEIEVVK